MNETSLSVRRILTGVACGAAIVVPLLLLFQPAENFPGDWSNHLWMIAYYGNYFRAHGSLPTSINTVPAVGLAQPVFYAWLLYPALGMASAAVGAAAALRLAVTVMLAIQFYALLSAGRKILGEPRLAYAMAVSVIWTTYSLTNLYNRGALAEYLATGFFVTALAFGAKATAEDGPSSRRFHAWLAGFFLVLTAGTHAPTAVLAAVFLVLLAIGGLVARGRGTSRAATVRPGWLAAVGLIPGAIILAPWVYASGRLAGRLALVRSGDAFFFCLEKCDSFWGRFAPFPYDASATENGIHGLGAAYLEAPINVVLLGILGWNLDLCRRNRAKPAGGRAFAGKSVLILTGGWFLFLTVLSLSPGFAARFHLLAPYIQYVYRLVSHCNAALLVAVLISGAWVASQGGHRREQQQTNVVAAVCLTVAVLGLWIKLQHAAVVIAPENGRPGSVIRRQMEVVPDYTVPDLVRELSDAEIRDSTLVAFPVAGIGSHFGEVGAVPVNQAHAGWVRTNAVVFPWLVLESDERTLDTANLARTGPFLAAYLPAGRHELRAVWRPDPLWSALNRISQWVFALVLLVMLVWAAIRLRARRDAASTLTLSSAP